jgi:hypothetical protein
LQQTNKPLIQEVTLEYLGYAAIAVVALLVGWFLRRPKVYSRANIRITLENDGDQWTKNVFLNHSEIHTGEKINWHFHTPKDAEVTVTDFRDKNTHQPKDPLKHVPSGPIHLGHIDSIIGECRGNEIFDEKPPGDRDAFGRYQDFTYRLKLKVGNQTFDIDPEIRIREV